MRYTKDNQIFNVWEIRSLFPETSISDGCDLTHLGYETLIETPMPIQDGFVAVENGAINNELQWRLEPIVIEVPQIISMRQARFALLNAGLLATVDNAVANGTDEAMKIEWEYATEVRRDWASLIAMATAIGLTSDQLDELFIAGAKL